MRATALILVLALSACAGAPKKDPYELPPEAVSQPAPSADGSIFRAAQNIALFEDRKARQVGDILTVLLVEKTDASKSAATSTSKDTSISMAAPTFGVKTLADLNLDVAPSQSFDGAGDTSQSNALSGSVTVLITRVLPNGNLVIRGNKHIQLNQGTEVVSIEGIVRPADIAYDNSVPSNRVANAQIKYSGDGAVADASKQGWLTRFFNSAWFPF